VSARPLYRSVLVAAATLVACTPPESQRVRGGDPGADSGNRDTVVEMHEGAEVYDQTPCLTTVEPCTGPLPRFGLPELDES
jgi:hypothetical protein